MAKRHSFPTLAHRFFKWYCNPEKYEELQGDLEELYYEKLESSSVTRAQWFYWLNVLKCCQPYAWKKINGHSNSTIAMFQNFYITAIRNFFKYKRYSLINTTGLAIGIASFTFIALYIINELSYDRFHSDHERIYRVSNRAVINGIPNQEATTGGPMAKTLRNDYPEVEKATRLLRSSQLLLGRGARKINEDNVIYADENFFDVFDFELVQGNAETALTNPRSMVLSESYAKKYFGDSPALGETLTVEEDTIFYTVTGILQDVPANSHLQLDILASISSKEQWNTDRWIGTNQHTYVTLHEEVQPQLLEEKMMPIFYEKMAPEIEYFTGLKIEEWESAGNGNSVRFKLVPLTDIHLNSDYSHELEASGNMTYIYVYGIIAMVILVIAIFNFVNLATAHSSTRSKEVGVRKSIGSTKKDLITQFLFESVLMSCVAALLSAILVFLFWESYLGLIGKPLAFTLWSSYHGLLYLFVLALLVGFFSGFYPAFVLSSFRASEVLKGKMAMGSKAGWLRNALVTLQFAASVSIIIGTGVIYTQLDHMITKNLGFDKEQILVLKRPDVLGRNLEVFKESLRADPAIKVVANSETVPGKGYAIRSYRSVNDPKTFLFQNNQVTYEHQDLMGFELLEGRFFSKDFKSDSSAVIINEAAMQAFGFEQPIGETLVSAFRKGENLKIIGVIKDYNIESLHSAIGPMTLELSPQNNRGYLSIKLDGRKDIRENLIFIENTWEKYASGRPLQYFFLDQAYENLYQSESSTGNVLLVFASLSVFIACMGLVGLVSYTSSIRKKEIGIRKVLGANLLALIRILSEDIVRLMVVAIVLAWPLAYFGSNYWLQNFADRVSTGPWVYIGSTLALILAVALAIGSQTVKIALRNPVESLKEE